MQHIVIVNGPNLNLTGIREPGIYGAQTFETFIESLRSKYVDIQIDYFQSNVEGEIINVLHRIGFTAKGIILNAGAYSHTSIAIADAIKAIYSPTIEVHISNILTRENYRHNSITGTSCVGTIMGFGLKSYELALNYFVNN